MMCRDADLPPIPAPVRLNAPPRFVGEEPLVVDGRTGGTEVVWGRRLCPARVRVVNVPAPDSGHRFGDVVLHDGDPVGTRRLDGRERGVFNEITLWERSGLSTLTATVEAPDPAAVEELSDVVAAAGGAAEDWTSSFLILCRACSEGSPDSADHEHQHDEDPEAAWEPGRSVGIAADPHTVGPLLERWVAGGPGRRYADLELALE